MSGVSNHPARATGALTASGGELDHHQLLTTMERPSRVSRLSVHPKYGPRQSVFVGNSGGYGSENDFVCSPFLRECVMALEDCCEEVCRGRHIVWYPVSAVNRRMKRKK